MRHPRPQAVVLALALSLAPAGARAEAPPQELDGALGTAVLGTAGTMLSARFGLEFFGFLTTSLRAFGVLGSASQAWGAYPELRLHWPGHLLKPYAAVGVGVGQALTAPSTDGPVHFAPGVFLALSLGMAIELGQFDLGAEAGVQSYADGFHPAIFPDGSFRAMPAGIALLTFGYRFPKRAWFQFW
jgi:hypothetical protein